MRALLILLALFVSSCFKKPADVDYDAGPRDDASHPDGHIDSGSGPDAMPDAAVDGPPNTYHVGGQVAGMWDGAAVQLHLTATGVDELLTVDSNRGFNFNDVLDDAASFSIAIETQPTGHNCVVSNGIGTIAGADNLDARIDCTGPAVAIAMSAPIDWTFDPATTSYAIDTSVIIQQTSFTVTAPTATAIALNTTTSLSSGVASVPVPLAAGANSETVKVSVGAISRIYTIGLNRGGAAMANVLYAKASNTGASDQFGNAVAIDHDLLVVGAPFEDSGTGVQSDNSATDAGAAYVFRRVGLTWVQEAYLKPAVRHAGDRFGLSVAASGDTVVVGAPYERSAATGINGNANDMSTTDAGAAYVFRYVGSTWTQEAYVKPGNLPNTTEVFGKAVAIDGDTMVIGAPGEDGGATGVNGNPSTSGGADAGATYVFVRSGTTWSQQAYVKATNTAVNDTFGAAVAISHDTLVVGANNESSCATGVGGSQSNNSCGSAGAVYTYHRTGITWVTGAYLKSANTAAAQLFGSGVATDGTVIVVGNGSPIANSYTFRLVGNAWTPEQTIQPDATFGTYASSHVSLVGDLIVMAGSTTMYLYRWSGATWVSEGTVTSGSADGLNVPAITWDTLVGGATNNGSAATGINPTDHGNGAPSSGAMYGYW